MSVIWLNGELVAPEAARVSALDRGLLNGVGLFETLRAYRGTPWALDDHHARLRVGGELIDVEVPGVATIRAAIDEVLRANNLSDAGIRVTITGGAGPVDVQADPDQAPSLIVIVWALRDYTDLYENGASLVTIAEGGRPLAGIKTTSYAVSVAGRVLAHRAGADDALFLGGDGRVLEATASNIFGVNGQTLRTPAVDEAILPGVTRHYVIEVARGLGFDVVEELLPVDDLLASDEVVLTSSLREIYPVRSIDGTELKRGGVSEKLRDAYRDLVLNA